MTEELSYRESCLLVQQALEALPKKELINNFYKNNNCFCGVGAVAQFCEFKDFFSEKVAKGYRYDKPITDLVDERFDFSGFKGISVEVLNDIQRINDSAYIRSRDVRYRVLYTIVKEFNEHSKYATLTQISLFDTLEAIDALSY